HLSVYAYPRPRLDWISLCQNLGTGSRDEWHLRRGPNLQYIRVPHWQSRQCSWWKRHDFRLAYRYRMDARTDISIKHYDRAARPAAIRFPTLLGFRRDESAGRNARAGERARADHLRPRNGRHV